MSYELNKKIRELEPYEPISGTYKIRLDANECPENYPDFIKEEIKNKTIRKIEVQEENKEIVEANIKKEKIYQENPRLQEIDDELSKFSIQTAKSILQNM